MQGHLDVLDVLLRRGAPLEAANVYGGTVLGAAVWASAHGAGVFGPGGFAPVDHAPVVERLLAAGARAEAAGFPSGRAAVDAVRALHGVRAP